MVKLRHMKIKTKIKRMVNKHKNCKIINIITLIYHAAILRIDWIRTNSLLLPKQTHYQFVLLSVKILILKA